MGILQQCPTSQAFILSLVSSRTIHLATLSIFTLFKLFTMRLSLYSAVLTAFGAAEAVSAFGYMPRDSGIDFADYPWQAPGPNDLRSPCPGLK